MTTPPIITPEQFDFVQFRAIQPAPRTRGNPRTRQKFSYKNIITAFDIETTSLPEVQQAVMYVWQWQFGDACTVIGRTWEQLRHFMDSLQACLKSGERLVVYVHNLSYEFQFLRAIIDWAPEDVFAVDSRKVLKAITGPFEFRCSYLHSNMNLKQYLDKMKTDHRKLSGDEFNYKARRFWWTPLTAEELAYCQNDVVGLVEALEAEMAMDGDNLYTIPLTSTGYVRRDAKRALASSVSNIVRPILPSVELYDRLLEAFRGGNTHANRYYAGQIIENVHSFDKSSSYPSAITTRKFPMGPFKKCPDGLTVDQLSRTIKAGRKAVLAVVTLTNVRLADPSWGCPYLSFSKCRGVTGEKLDNGRILEADTITTTVTDLDLIIIEQEYDWDEMVVEEAWLSRYGTLPSEFIKLTNFYFTKKTELKGDAEQEVYYNKLKALLNSLYGMMAQRPVKISQIFNGTDFEEEYQRVHMSDDEWEEVEEELLNQSNGRAFMAYQWGVWVTAWARYELERGIRLVHEQGRFLYCDTDSVKYCGTVDWSKINAEYIKDAKAAGAFAVDCKGEAHYMGVYEPDGDYIRFATRGAKKYAFEKKDKKTGRPVLGITIAGVGKEKGAVELGKLENFLADFFIFSAAGGTESIYNDHTTAPLTIDGHLVELPPNIYLKDSTYKLQDTVEYSELLQILRTCGIDTRAAV